MSAIADSIDVLPAARHWLQSLALHASHSHTQTRRLMPSYMQDSPLRSDSSVCSSLGLSTSSSGSGEEPSQGGPSFTGSQQALAGAQPPELPQAQRLPGGPGLWGPEALLHLSLADGQPGSIRGSLWQDAMADAAQQPPSPGHVDQRPDWARLLRSPSQHAPGAVVLICTNPSPVRTSTCVQLRCIGAGHI